MKKIGVYDSGLGGVSLIGQLSQLKAAPFHEIFYFSDYSRLPYGNHDPEKLNQIGFEISQHLVNQGVDIILVACNTATVNSIEYLRSKFSIPFVGIEPYVNAVNRENDILACQRVGLIMTPSTAKSLRYQWLVNKYDNSQKIVSIPHEKMATLIESYLRKKHQILTINNKLLNDQLLALSDSIVEEIESLKNFDIDALILGCTHYPIFKNLFSSKLKIPIVDPAPFVIDQLLKISGLKNEENGLNKVYYSESISNVWKEIKLSDLLTLIHL